jgi:UPF0755 protein
VIYNRLHDGIPLGIDATTRFAVNNWTSPLTGAQLRSASPYNTYVQRGLPPGPICSPGLASLDAVAQPATTDALYFVARADGSHVFARTLDEHLANMRREQAGGR